MRRIRSSNRVCLRSLAALSLVALAALGCQSGPTNPLAPGASAVTEVAPTASPAASRPGSGAASAAPDQVCRGGPGGFPCWTPGSRPPTGPQPQSGLITFDFTGTVSHVPDPISGGPFAIGQAVSGSYTFDPAAADQDPSAGIGLYDNVTSFNVSIPAANYSGTASPASQPGFIEILDNEDGVRDRYVVSMTAPNQNVSGPSVAGATLTRLAIVLRDRTTLAVSSDALPLVPPSLSDFAFGHEFFAGFTGASGIVEMGVTLTSLTSN